MQPVRVHSISPYIPVVKYCTADDPTFAIVLEMKDTVPSEPKGKVRSVT